MSLMDEEYRFYPDTNTNMNARFALAEPNEMLEYADFDLFEHAYADPGLPAYWNDFPHYHDHTTSYISPNAHSPPTRSSGPSTGTTTPIISTARSTPQRESNKLLGRSRHGSQPTPSLSSASSSPSTTTTTSSSRSSPVSCPHCPRTFPRPCDLNRHLHRHFPTFQCSSPGCSEAFALRKDCRRHEQCVHGLSSPKDAGSNDRGNNSKGDEKEGLKCVVRDCGYTSLRRDNWRRHLRKVHAILMD